MKSSSDAGGLGPAAAVFAAIVAPAGAAIGFLEPLKFYLSYSAAAVNGGKSQPTADAAAAAAAGGGGGGEVNLGIIAEDHGALASSDGADLPNFSVYTDTGRSIAPARFGAYDSSDRMASLNGTDPARMLKARRKSKSLDGTLERLWGKERKSSMVSPCTDSRNYLRGVSTGRIGRRSGSPSSSATSGELYAMDLSTPSRSISSLASSVSIPPLSRSSSSSGLSPRRSVSPLRPSVALPSALRTSRPSTPLPPPPGAFSSLRSSLPIPPAAAPPAAANGFASTDPAAMLSNPALLSAMNQQLWLQQAMLSQALLSQSQQALSHQYASGAAGAQSPFWPYMSAGALPHFPARSSATATVPAGRES